MEKQNFVPRRLMLVLVALAVSMTFTGIVYADCKRGECVKPGNYCYQLTWEATNNPYAPTAPFDGGVWYVKFSPAGDGIFSASTFIPSDPVTQVPAYCFGQTRQIGTQVITTYTCQEGSIATDYYTSAWTSQFTFDCNKGVLATSGTWDSIFTYTLPFGNPAAELAPGMYGPYYGAGTSALVDCPATGGAAGLK